MVRPPMKPVLLAETSFMEVAARMKAQQDAFLALPPEEQAKASREQAIKNARIFASFGQQARADAELAAVGLSTTPPARPRTRKTP